MKAEYIGDEATVKYGCPSLRSRCNKIHRKRGGKSRIVLNSNNSSSKSKSLIVVGKKVKVAAVKAVEVAVKATSIKKKRCCMNS